MLFWLMVWGGVALLLSGSVLWFVAAVPPSSAVRSGSPCSSTPLRRSLTIGGFIVHVYMGLAVVPGGLRAILHGEVSEEWARQHHPLVARRRRSSGAAAP